jgi:predicted lipoprotein
MRLVPFLCALLFAAQAFAQEGAPPPPAPTAEALQAATQRAVDGYIVGAYDALAAQTATFADGLTAYCATHDLSQAASADYGFTALLEKWAGVDFINFGPISRDTRFDRFAFWPDPHGTGDRQLRQFLARPDPAILAPGALRKQSAAIQGLPALEILLYSGTKSPIACDLAKAIAANLHEIAASAAEEWKGDKGWRALMLSPGPGNPVYTDANQSLTDVLRALLLGLEVLRDQRIQPARGPMPDAAKASRAPYWRSGSSIAYWRASAAALQRYAEAAGLTQLVASGDTARALNTASEFEFRNLAGALGAVSPPLDKALVDPQPRGKLGYALLVLQSLRAIYQTQLPGAAGISPGFNALDGD